MKIIILSLVSLLLLTACDRAKQTAKDAINKTGEVSAKAASEFADGVDKGIQKSFENEVQIAPALQSKIKTGKINIHSGKDATDNILSVYIIFEDNTDTPLTVKISDEKNKEYARTTTNVAGKKNEARYIDFVFDNRTNIDGRSKIVIE